MDAAVAVLQEKKGAWVATSVRERIEILSQLLVSFAAVADRWTAAALAAEGLRPDAVGSGEEALVGPYMVLRNLRLLRTTLSEIESTGKPRIPGPVSLLPSGQVSARVFPGDLYDRILYGGISADVWMEPGVTPESLPSTMATIYGSAERKSGAALVLSAGNVSSIGPLDALYKLFAEDQVVLYKTHPVNAYLGPLFAEGFGPLVERGFLRVVYGGAEAGAYLCKHAGIDEIHITGSDRTYDAIIFGPGPEGAERKKKGEPLLRKPVSAELGNVSPVIVVPGPWSASDFAYQGENLATMLSNNAGFNCNAARVIVQQEGWPGRERLLESVRGVLGRVPTRRAYYPGAAERFDAFLKAHGNEAETFGSRSGDQLPWALLPHLDPAAEDDICFRQEAFCGVFAETALAAPSVPEFLKQAADFCNDVLWGTLNITLLVHPATLESAENRSAFEGVVAALRYGTVSINHWAALGYGLGVTPWGAFPGHTPQDIQSGTGFVHNTLLFSRIQKAVLRSPFRAWPKPVWFATHQTAHRLTPKLTRFEADRSPAKLPGILALALRG
jgi:hypothetical protein